MYCDHCGKPLRGGDQKFCPECGAPTPVSPSPRSSQPSSSALSDPRILVLITAFILIAVAIDTLNRFAALLAVLLIAIAGFAIFNRRIKPKLKLAGLGFALVLVLFTNTIEGWIVKRDEAKQEEQRKEQAAAQEQQNRQREEERQKDFSRMTPKQHLDTARGLLKPEATQSALDNALKHLNAIPPSAPESSLGKQMKLQYETAK